MLVLLFFCVLSLTSGQGPSCPERKTVGDICYERYENGVDTSSYSCTASCTYKKQYADDDERFCFRAGGLLVTQGCIDPIGPVTESPPKFNIVWKYGMHKVTHCVEPGTTVSFNWDNFGHNVNKMKESDWKNCINFSNTRIEGGPHIFQANAIGTYYFACGVPTHCKSGHMQAKITVANNCEDLLPIIDEDCVTRLNVSSISTPHEASPYNEALEFVKKMKGQRNFTNIGSYHGRPWMCNLDQTGLGTSNGCCIPHWGQMARIVLFTPWHRLIEYQMEQSLRLFNNNLGIPYWDWTVPPSDGHELPYLARHGQWQKGPIKPPTKGVNGSPETSRSPRLLNYKWLEKQVEMAFCLKTFTEFNQQINIPHNYIHWKVGGDMATFSTASYDPIFYLHHSYVDLQYAYYQELQTLRSLSINFGTHGHHKMYPFAGSINPYTTSKTHSTGPEGVDYKNVFRYDFEKLIFKGMIPNDFYDNENQICKPKIFFAGLFKKQTGITSSIDFDILQNSISTYAGSVYTFGSQNQNPDFSGPTVTSVLLYDVTELVHTHDKNLKFAVSKYTDAFGNDLPLNETFQPIIVYQDPSSENYIFRLHVEQVHEYAPVMYGRIGHRVEFLKNGKVVSGDDDVKTWVGGTDEDSDAGKPVDGTVAIVYQEHKFIVNNEYGQTNISIGYDFYCFECNPENFPISLCTDTEIIPWNLDWLKENPVVNITNCPLTNTIIASCDHTLSTVKKVDKNDYDGCTNLWTKGTDGIYGLLVDTSIPGTYYFADGQKTETPNQNYCDLGWKITINIIDCEQN